MANDKRRFSENIIEQAKGVIPPVDDIIELTWKKLKLNELRVTNNFSETLIQFDKIATEEFREHEKQATIKLAKLWINMQGDNMRKTLKKILSNKGWDNFVEEASRMFVEFAELVKDFEKDLGNMRKARGGKTFEKTLLKLLRFINIPCEIPSGKEREILRRIDLVIPSIIVAQNTPDRALFITCKRTLRERWKQEIPQVRLNQRIYLITIDEDLPVSKANEINEKSLIAFVRDEIKERNHINSMSWIRKLSNLPKELKAI